VPYFAADIGIPFDELVLRRLSARRVSALMGLAGLPLGTLLGIFGAASALVVVFYILKLRRRAVPVPFSRIWDSVLRDKQATELFSKLRRMLSLLLQLALLALCAGARRSQAKRRFSAKAGIGAAGRRQSRR